MNKKLFWIVLIPALFVIGVYLFVRYSLQSSVWRGGEKISNVAGDTSSQMKTTALDLRPLFLERLQQLVAKTSNDIYNVSVDSMTVDVLASRVSFQKVVLTPDNKRADSLSKLGLAPAETFSFSFDKLEVEGINLDDAITQKTMDYKLVKLTRPVFHIYQAPNDTADPKEDFSRRFLKEMDKLSVKQLLIVDGKVIIHNKGKSTTLNDVDIDMKNILIDSVTRTDPKRFLFANSASINFKNYKVAMTGGDYNLSVGKVNVEAPEQKVTLTNVSFSPPIDKKQFAGRQKVSREYYNLSLPSVTINAVNWWSLLNQNEVDASQVNINGGKLFIYLDRSLPRASKMGNFPAQLLMKLPTKINIDRMRLNNVDLAYEEFNPLSQQSGTIHIRDVSMNITNVSNTPAKALRPVTVRGGGLLMGKVPLTANFSFSREKYKSGSFTARINSTSVFEGSLINSFAIPMGLIKIERGLIKRITADIKGDELQASGDITVLYNDIKLGLLEKDKGKKKLDKKSVTSFLANAVVLKKDNPREGEAPRKVQAAFTRVPEGGFFLLVWKTMLTGALKTLGAPTKIATKSVSDN